MHRFLSRHRWLLGGLLSFLVLLGGFASMPAAIASVHVYRERPGQVTVRSRQNLRDYRDRAWQVVAFKRTQGQSLQGYFLRLVGFPGAVEVDRRHPVVLLSPTGQSWQLPWAVDPQAKTLPPNVGQFDLQPLLADLNQPVPLEGQLVLTEDEPAEFAIAPFIVEEWLQVKTRNESPAPMRSPLGE